MTERYLGGCGPVFWAMRMENPLVGSFNRERTILTFRQRSIEFFASLSGMGLGGFMILTAFFGPMIPFVPAIGPPIWSFFFGGLFFLASLAAYLGFRSIRFDTRRRTFAERSRLGLFPTVRTGSIDEVRCLELAPYDGFFPASITQSATPGVIAAPVHFGQLYVVRLWWHDARRPPVVVEHVQAMQAYGSVDSQLAGFAQKAQQYSNALRVPLYSNLPLPGMTRVQ